jgi:hypothetical protein
MSWRGVSTARQLTAPPLDAPTLVVHWWTSVPVALCFVLPQSASESWQIVPLPQSDEITSLHE